MRKRYQSHVAQTIGELWDLLGSMMLSSPRFEDKTGYFPGMNIETEFAALDESLEVLRPILGDDRYTKLVDMAARMRAHFEADPDDKTDDALAGRNIILQMEDILKEVDDPADHPDYTGPRG